MGKETVQKLNSEEDLHEYFNSSSLENTRNLGMEKYQS